MKIFLNDLVSTRLIETQASKVMLAGNPWLKEVKSILKDGGVPRLFSAMRDPGWDKLIQSQLSNNN
jgi:hypothetical protein